MLLRVGYELIYDCPQPTPMILSLRIHSSRADDIVVADDLVTTPHIPITGFQDAFGNWCSRIIVPMGESRLSADAIVKDNRSLDAGAASAAQVPVQDLPEETLMFLLGSRYCETDLLTETAWDLFDKAPAGGARVQAICDFVHQHIRFGYEHALRTKTACQAFNDRNGVCRDYTHLAIAFCRCMNIPARYCTGYLSDVGIPPPYGLMDFAAWFEVFLEGGWHTFDPRNNEARIGRVLIARGRDAADVAISTTFGSNTLKGFKVWTDEVGGGLPDTVD